MRARRGHPGHRGCLAILLAFIASVSGAAQPTHLLGFVDTFCSDEPYCFELRVKPEFRGALGKRIKVRFGSETRIFDPENYELTLHSKISYPAHTCACWLIAKPAATPLPTAQATSGSETEAVLLTASNHLFIVRINLYPFQTGIRVTIYSSHQEWGIKVTVTIIAIIVTIIHSRILSLVGS